MTFHDVRCEVINPPKGESGDWVIARRCSEPRGTQFWLFGQDGEDVTVVGPDGSRVRDKWRGTLQGFARIYLNGPQEITLQTHDGEKTFRSRFDWLAAQNELRAKIERGEVTSDFARSLASVDRPSPKQTKWIHYLAVGPSRKDEEKEEKAYCKKLVTLIYIPKVSGTLKRPVIRLQSNAIALRLSIASEKSKFPGDVWVADGRKKLLGRIEKTTGLVRVKSEGAVTLLKMANEDPVEYARTYGRDTGNCCFCGRLLERQDSIDYGYGPICASRYGLFHPCNQENFDDS